ncbi:hypothetical protein [Streptomyces sp. C10-9-1]
MTIQPSVVRRSHTARSIRRKQDGRSPAGAVAPPARSGARNGA